MFYWLKTLFNLSWLLEPSVSVAWGGLIAFAAAFAVLFVVRHFRFVKVESSFWRALLIGLLTGLLLVLLNFMKGGSGGKESAAPTAQAQAVTAAPQSPSRNIEIIFDLPNGRADYKEGDENGIFDRSIPLEAETSANLLEMIREEFNKTKNKFDASTLFLITIVNCDDIALPGRLREISDEVFDDRLYGSDIDVLTGYEEPD